MKTAVMTDSNSGIKPEEGEKLGVFSLSMPVIIDGKVYFEGKDIEEKEFYDSMISGKDVTSSQPSPGDVMDMWDSMLENGYDEVVYIPMSSGLSASCHAAIQLSEEYDGKVQVVDNHRISVTMREAVRDAKWMADNGVSAKEIKDALEKNAYDSVIFLTVDDLKYLKKGGRITPAAATLGAVLNIKPILTTVGEKFDAIEKVRGMKKSLAKLLDYTEEFVNKTLAEKPDAEIRIGAAGTFTNDQAAEEWYNEVKERFPNVKDIYYNPLSFSICCHTGPDAVGIGVSVILRDE
nr:DegV family protein [uncultured Eubacterium sp.]